MIDPNFYTIQHIELEVAELDIDEGLKDVLLATLERYNKIDDALKVANQTNGKLFNKLSELQNKLAEIEKQAAISKMEATANGLNLRLIEDCLLIYKTQLYSDDWSGLRDKVSEQIDILAKLNKQGA